VVDEYETDPTIAHNLRNVNFSKKRIVSRIPSQHNRQSILRQCGRISRSLDIFPKHSYWSSLLLDLIDLLIDLLPALTAVPVLQEHTARILEDFQLGAHNCEARLYEPILMRCALVLLLPRVCDVVIRRKRIAFEYARVLLDNRHVRLEFRQTRVTELVCTREVRVRNRVRALQVGVEWRDEAAVRVGCEVESTGAKLGVLESFDSVVHDGVGLEMLLDKSLGM
jgi:hypothetical protein